MYIKFNKLARVRVKSGVDAGKEGTIVTGPTRATGSDPALLEQDEGERQTWHVLLDRESKPRYFNENNLELINS